MRITKFEKISGRETARRLAQKHLMSEFKKQIPTAIIALAQKHNPDVVCKLQEIFGCK